MSGTLDGKSALVTGGAGGFGKACALALARDGAAVTLMGRNAASLAQARAWLLAQAPDARIAVHAGDATADADVQAALASAVAHGGGLDIVVATVGGGGYRTVLEQDLATFMADMQLNVGSAFAAVRHGAPLMRDGGAFVFISSTAAVLSFQGLSSYCAGKAALDHFVRVAADELGSRGIRLNCVRPGTHAHRRHGPVLREPGLRRIVQAADPAGTHRHARGRRGRRPLPGRPRVLVDHRAELRGRRRQRAARRAARLSATVSRGPRRFS
jgi:NAD(P)-dependent dehydrogenase (short-subunit alcohol dehydrogenase family)